MHNKTGGHPDYIGIRPYDKIIPANKRGATDEIGGGVCVLFYGRTLPCDTMVMPDDLKERYESDAQRKAKQNGHGMPCPYVQALSILRRSEPLSPPVC